MEVTRSDENGRCKRVPRIADFNVSKKPCLRERSNAVILSAPRRVQYKKNADSGSGADRNTAKKRLRNSLGRVSSFVC